MRKNFTLVTASLRALWWLKMPAGNKIKMYLLRWGKCILLYFYEQCLCHRIIFTIGHALELYICSTEYSSLWQRGFLHNITFKKFFICFGICKRKKNKVWFVNNKIAFLLNSIMAFSFLNPRVGMLWMGIGRVLLLVWVNLACLYPFHLLCCGVTLHCNVSVIFFFFIAPEKTS